MFYFSLMVPRTNLKNHLNTEFYEDPRELKEFLLKFGDTLFGEGLLNILGAELFDFLLLFELLLKGE